MAYKIFDPESQYMKGYKIRIYPTKTQAEIIDRRFEISIAIYNWTLEQEIKQYELYKNGGSDKKFLSYYDMINLFTIFRNENPWVKDMPHGSGCKSIHNAIISYQMFFRYNTNFPKFKSKKHLRKMSYGVRHDTMYFDNNLLKIEGFNGEYIYTKWNSGHSGASGLRKKYYQPTISKDNLGRYYISFSMIKNKHEKQYISSYSNPIGIDLNVKDRFVCSNGYRSGSPDISRLKRGLSKLESLVQNDIKRRKKEARNKSLEYINIQYSKRAIKRLNKRRKKEDKINNIVENFIQQETNKIIKMNPTVVVMEGLSVMDMEKNKKVSKHVYYSNFNRCITVMKNKCNNYNIPFISAPGDYPSSQLCSNCGSRRKIYSQKTYICPKCGLVIDRDLNAALNLKKLAL